MMRCAAMAMVCKPESRNGSRWPRRWSRAAGAQRDLARDVGAGRALACGAAHEHVLDFSGFDAARSIACLTTCPPMVAPVVMLRAPARIWRARCVRWKRYGVSHDDILKKRLGRAYEFGYRPQGTLRASRANRVFCTDKKRIRTEKRLRLKAGTAWGCSIQDRRLRADRFFVRTQSTIRRGRFSSAQYRSIETKRSGAHGATHRIVQLKVLHFWASGHSSGAGFQNSP